LAIGAPLATVLQDTYFDQAAPLCGFSGSTGFQGLALY